MIFGKHNFTHNFLNAVGYQDEFMTDQIIIDEVARLLVEEKKNVVEALRKVGVNATYRDNNDLIKSMLIKEVEDNNPTILKFLADNIIHNQVDLGVVKEIAALAKKTQTEAQTKNVTGAAPTTTHPSATFSKNLSTILNDDGATTSPTFGSKLNTILSNDVVKESLSALIAGGIQKVFSKSGDSKVTNDQLLSERLKINEMQAAAAKTSKKKLLVLLLVSAGVLIVGGTVYFFVSRKYEKGGMIAGSPGLNTVTTTSMPPADI